MFQTIGGAEGGDAGAQRLHEEERDQPPLSQVVWGKRTHTFPVVYTIGKIRSWEGGGGVGHEEKKIVKEIIENFIINALKLILSGYAKKIQLNVVKKIDMRDPINYAPVAAVIA